MDDNRINLGDEELLNVIKNRKDILLQEIERLKEEIKEVNNEIQEAQELEEKKATTKAKQLLIGCKNFNSDRKKGIKYLVEHDLIQETPNSVANFLFTNENLSKVAIGDYLGEKQEFNLTVLTKFVGMHDFTGKSLDFSLRQFLYSFRLPGEAQKIDRMMESFASRYCDCNQTVFSNPDTCYILSFAIIMLNTSLHNPSVKDKPSVERFIAMNRGIDDGKDLPNSLLIALYDSIKKQPFKILEEDTGDLATAFFNPDKESWLLKQGGRVKSWKRRWFVLVENCLYYFEYPSDKEPKGIIPLENLQVRVSFDQKKPHCFELYLPEDALVPTIKAAKTTSEGRVVEGKHTTYRMSAATATEKDDWIRCLRRKISQDPYYDMIAARKRSKHTP